MRIFNTLQELWGYCAFCPICKKNNRVVYPVAATDFCRIAEFLKEEIALTLLVEMENPSKDSKKKCDRTILTIIDCENGSIGSDSIPPVDFSFYLKSKCENCQSYVTTSFIDIIYMDKKISNYRISYEEVYYKKTNNKLHVTFCHDIDMIFASKITIDDNNEILHEDNGFRCPIINLSLTEHEKITNKIKTFLIFS